MDKTLLAQAYNEAPPALQLYIKSKEFEKRIIELAVGLSLSVSTYLPLKNASVLIFLNIADANDLVSSLQRSLGVDEARAALVAKKIDEMVLEEIQKVLEEKAADTIKELKLSSGASEGGDLRVTMLAKKESQAVAPKKEEVKPQSRSETSRTMLMDQLSLIGQIPKDEDVLQRLSKIKEQLRRGEDQKAKLDEEIRLRSEAEKIKSLEASKVHVPRKVYDVDPYREHFASEEEEL